MWWGGGHQLELEPMRAGDGDGHEGGPTRELLSEKGQSTLRSPLQTTLYYFRQVNNIRKAGGRGIVHVCPGGGTLEIFDGGLGPGVLPLHPLLGHIIPKYDPSLGHFGTLQSKN